MAERTVNSRFYKPQSLIGETYLELKYDPTNGNVTLYQYIEQLGIVGVRTKVYQNGVWEYNPGAITTVSEKTAVHRLVIETISRLKGTPGYVIPAFVTQNAESRDQGFSGETTVSQNSGGLIGRATEAIFDFPKIEDYGTNMARLFPNILQYPLNIMESHQDVLVITQYEYKAPYYDVIQGSANNANILTQGTQRGSALRKKIQQLFLPIPSNVSDSNSADWGSGETISTAGLAAMGDMKTVSVAAAASEIAGKVAQLLPGKADIASIIQKNPEALYSLLSGNFMSSALPSAIQSAFLNKVGFQISPETILSRGYGVVPNSNLELLFNGPTLRQFVFGYIMDPRSKNEAEMCRKILRFFKQGMAPKKKQGGYGAASYFLATPNVFKLKYRTWDYSSKSFKDIEGLNKFKICALTDLRTSYAPDGPWAAYEKGQPARMQVNFTFKELEPVYESDYQATVAPDYQELVNKNSQEVDLRPVRDGEIGY